MYWVVLLYLPDLQWCRVAPLKRAGYFGDELTPGARAAMSAREKGPRDGQPRWIRSEERNDDIDVGAGRCQLMDAVEVKKRPQEWLILGPEDTGTR